MCSCVLPLRLHFGESTAYLDLYYEAKYIEQGDLIAATFTESTNMSAVDDGFMIISIIINTVTKKYSRNVLMGDEAYEFRIENNFGEVGSCTIVGERD